MRMKLVLLFSIMLWAACVVASESADSLYLQAEQKYQTQHYEDAAALLERAVAIAPEVQCIARAIVGERSRLVRVDLRKRSPWRKHILRVEHGHAVCDRS